MPLEERYRNESEMSPFQADDSQVLSCESSSIKQPLLPKLEELPLSGQLWSSCCLTCC